MLCVIISVSVRARMYIRDLKQMAHPICVPYLTYELDNLCSFTTLPIFMFIISFTSDQHCVKAVDLNMYRMIEWHEEKDVREGWYRWLQEDRRKNEQQVKSFTYALSHTHAGYGEVATVGWWLVLTAKDTTDDNSINPVSPLPPSLSTPLLPPFLSPFIDERLPLFLSMACSHLN